MHLCAGLSHRRRVSETKGHGASFGYPVELVDIDTTNSGLDDSDVSGELERLAPATDVDVKQSRLDDALG